MGLLGDCFAGLPDRRTGNAMWHQLLEVLTIALVGSSCGAESCVDFADFARDREALFRDFLKLENGLPSHDTFSRLFRLLDPAAFAGCSAHLLDGLGEAGRGVLAIDGKTLRRSFDRAGSTSPLAVVTAFACEARLVLGKVAIPNGGNEIPRPAHCRPVRSHRHAGHRRCHPLPNRDRAPGAGSRGRVVVRTEGEPAGHAGRGH